ncbi:MAG: UDP-N-acetylmuramyl-tripeptide synthetase, partial [Clostridia bacterium]
MQLQDVLADVAVIATNCQMDMEIGGICHDSRTAQRGDLFVAIAGFKQDGNKYITAARAAGALAVVCENVPSDDIPYIQVVNARVALAAVAANFCAHPARAMTMIGVTGTNGKTTVTYLLKEVLEARGAVVGLIGTNQNMIGDTPVYTERTTPEPNELQHLLRRMADAGCTHVVMEVSSHSLVLGRVYGIEFQLGIFTNVSQDHLDFHNTMEEYIAAKALLFAQCRHGVVNLDDDAAGAVMAGGMCDFTTYSTRNNKADVTAENIHLKADGVMFEAVCKNQIARVELAIPGEFSVYNALAVV